MVAATRYTTKSHHYRLFGRPEVAKWGTEPGYCDCSIRDGVVQSYGGQLWPSAWPSIFNVGPRTIYGQRTELTDAGKALIAEADRTFFGASPDDCEYESTVRTF